MSEFKSITFVGGTSARRVEVDGEELRQLTVEISALRAQNAQLEANLLDYWAAHGAVKHIEEPRVVAELKARARELEADLRQRTGERDSALGDVARLTEQLNDREAAGFRQASADFVERQERDSLRARNSELEAENAALCKANTEERDRRKAAEKRVALYTGWHEEILPVLDRARADLAADRDAARATVERVREHVNAFRAGTRTPHDVIGCIESALTPPGDGGGHG